MYKTMPENTASGMLFRYELRNTAKPRNDKHVTCMF